eukprot:366164-Chlamydomonas_euryale.AAC.4
MHMRMCADMTTFVCARAAATAPPASRCWSRWRAAGCSWRLMCTRRASRALSSTATAGSFTSSTKTQVRRAVLGVRNV